MAIKYALVLVAIVGLGSFVSLALAQVVGSPRVFQHRWVYATHYPHDTLLQVLDTAGKHGLTGVVLHYGADYPSDGDAWIKLISPKLQELNLEVVPTLFGIGYGYGLLARNPEAAEGVQVKDALFVVKGTVAKFVTEQPPDVRNGSFESRVSPVGVVGWTLDEPGKRGFSDTSVTHSGSASVRMEVVANEPGRSLVSQEVAVTPHRMYRLSGWLKTRNAEPADDCIVLRVMGPDGRSLTPFDLWPDGNQDWTRHEAGFNSWGNDRVIIQAGSIGCDTGTIWADDIQLEEISLVNVLSRPGAPFVVRDAETGTVYQPGVDYEVPVDPKRNYTYDHNGPDIKLTRRSAIKRKSQLRVSYYHASCASVCMSEPALYEEMRKIAEQAKRLFQPKRYLIPFSEIRGGGTCDACRRRNIPTAQIFGDSLIKQVNIIHEVDPQAEVLIYDDMINPYMNAVPMYYLVDGDLTRVADYIPRDVILMPWDHRYMEQSVALHARLGFRMVGSAWNDAPTLQPSHDWYRTLTRSPQSIGIAFYTWGGSYGLLGSFGDMVSQPFTETMPQGQALRHFHSPDRMKAAASARSRVRATGSRAGARSSYW